MKHDLHWLAESEQLDPLRDAIDAGADLSTRDEEGRTPLHVAVEYGRSAAVELLLAAGADVEAPEGAAPGFRPLHRACLPRPGSAAVDPTLIEILLKHGARGDVTDDRGTTPLHLCVEWCEADLVERLIGHAARAGACDRTGRTPLHVAVMRGAPVSAIEGLLEDDGEIAGVSRGRRRDSALSRLEDAAVLELLLAEGADPNAADRNQVTPLHVAASRGTAWAVRALLAAGADADAADEWGATPLHRAESAEIVELLLRRGAALDSADREGATPRHRAVARGAAAIVDRLIDGGADIAAVDGDGRTALHLAAAAGRGLTVDRLLDEGGDPRARDGDERTPLQLAVAGGHVHVVATLKRRQGRSGGSGGRGHGRFGRRK